MKCCLIVCVATMMGAGVSSAEDGAVSYREAIEAQLEQEPTNVMLQLRLGEAYVKEGDLERGKALLFEVGKRLAALVDANPESGKLHYALGLCFFFLGETSSAESEFKQAIALEPDFELAPLGLAKLYMEQKSFYRAGAVLRGALEASPDSEALRSALAETLASNGKVADALVQLQLLVERFPNESRYAKRLLELLIETGDVEKAVQLLDGLKESGEISEENRNLMLVEMYLDAGELREVPRLLQQVRRSAPDHPKLASCFARFYRLQGQQAAEREDWSRASLFFNRSLEFESEALETRQALGSAYLEMGDLEAANEQFLSILEHAPSDPVFYVDFARTQFGLGNAKLAVQVIEKAYESASSRKDLEAMKLFEEARIEMMVTIQELVESNNAGRNAQTP